MCSEVRVTMRLVGIVQCAVCSEAQCRVVAMCLVGMRLVGTVQCAVRLRAGS